MRSYIRVCTTILIIYIPVEFTECGPDFPDLSDVCICVVSCVKEARQLHVNCTQRKKNLVDDDDDDDDQDDVQGGKDVDQDDDDDDDQYTDSDDDDDIDEVAKCINH